MSGKIQRVVPHNGEWAVRDAGNSRVTTVHETQREAIEHARGIAQNQGSELFIHGRNGQIRERHPTGNDPIPPHACPPAGRPICRGPLLWR